jgi:hypothetical protein
MSGTVYYLIDTNYLNSGSESPITRAELNSEIETKEKTNGMELIKINLPLFVMRVHINSNSNYNWHHNFLLSFIFLSWEICFYGTHTNKKICFFFDFVLYKYYRSVTACVCQTNLFLALKRSFNLVWFFYD